MFSIPLLTVSIRLSEHRYIHARLFLPVSLLPSIPLFLSTVIDGVVLMYI